MATKRRRRKQQKLNLQLPRGIAIPVAFVLGISSGFVANEFYHDSFIQLEPNQVRACFTPGRACENSILSVINNAKQEILMNAYSFTSKPIAESLLSAHRRSVKVYVLYDQGAASAAHSQIPVLRRAGVRVIPQHITGIAHNKIVVIDRSIVVTGSYNFSNAAKNRNSENLIIVYNRDLAKQYAENWQRLASQ